MATVNFLAELWGFSLVLVCLALLVKPKNIGHIFGLVENGSTLALIGLINVVLGVALVLSYNVWGQSWQVIVTILGWLVIIRGGLILFFPEFIHHMVVKLKMRMDVLQIILVAGVILGCALVYLGMTY